ncbi:MAG TPA: right-handed parallel beta-helix repeat-containing protein [Natronosporangium sp.]
MGTLARAALLIVPFAALALTPGTALAHQEREVTFPDGRGSVPQYRTDGPQLLVCKTDFAAFEARIADYEPALRERNLALFEECQQNGYRHLQEAVDAATPGTRILVLPGVYQEEPSLEPPTGQCRNIDAPHATVGLSHYQVLSFEQQVACPHEQNLVAVLGKRDLQIEGTGAGPEDVIIDAQYRKLNAIRADRADGFYLRNLTAQRTTFNAVYVMETDGFAIDTVVARWNDEYGFLVFANDHGLLSNCEGYGNGDAAIYPGSASNINADAGHEVERYAVEITGCYGHHNLLGYSGTAGNSVWAHHNVFTENTAGVAMDSAFPNHPGLPQNHALFEHNVIAFNNQDYYRYVRDGTCERPSAQRGYERGVVCPAVGLPVGTGVINPGGNYNIFRDNEIRGHEYTGFLTSWVPGFIRGATGLGEQFDTSHHNRFYDNALRDNRIDFWWDGQGRGSCWQDAPHLVTEPRVLPVCGDDELPAGLPVGRLLPEPAKVLKLYVCNGYSLDDQVIPAGCDWYGATGLARIEVQAALAEAVLLGVLLLALWARWLRRSRSAAVCLVIAVAGLVVGVLGAGYEGSALTPIGLALFGIGVGWLGLLLRDLGRSGFGWLTVALGAVGLLGAVDRGLAMIPFIPVPPSVVRLLLELVWVPWAVVLLVRPRRASNAAPNGRPAPAAVPEPPAPEPPAAEPPAPEPATA